MFLRATFFRWARRIEEVCPDWPRHPPCCPLAMCTWRTSAPGGMPRADWSGASTISTRPRKFRIRSIWCGLRPARFLIPKSRLPHTGGATRAILARLQLKGLADPRPVAARRTGNAVASAGGLFGQDERTRVLARVEKLPLVPCRRIRRRMSCVAACRKAPCWFALRDTIAKGGGSLGRPRYFAVAEVAWRAGAARGQGSGAVRLGLGA